MKMSLLALPLAAAALVGATCLISSAAPAPGPSAAVDYTFHELPLNSMGVKSLAELRGKPVVIDFWGRH